MHEIISKEVPIEMKTNDIINEIVNLGAATDFEITAEDVKESLFVTKEINLISPICPFTLLNYP